MDKRKKVARASDGLARAEYIHQAQMTTFHRGPFTVLGDIEKVGPEIAHFIEAAAKDIASSAMYDANIPRPVAQI